MEWTHNDLPVTDEDVKGYVGFCYIITNTTDGRMYFGKKKLTRKKTRPPLKGKKRKRKEIVESDWRDYYGSSEDLLKDVELLGKDKFTRQILRFCKTLGECSYFEAKYIFEYDAIVSESFYNHWVSCRIRSSHLPKDML